MGTNAPAAVYGTDPLATTSNYLIGSDQNNWQTDVAQYESVFYTDIYDGIDLRYYGNQRLLEYDFMVEAGADASLIRLNFDGVYAVQIADNGELVLTLNEAGDEVRFRSPYSYQDIDGQRQTVASRYVIHEDGSVGFELGEYDATRELIIDPIFDYTTFVGGTGYDNVQGIAADDSGNVYITGYGGSTDFPTTSGAYDQTFGGGSYDVYVAKLSPDGSTLLYSTFIGGAGSDIGQSIAVDASGNAYVTGSTTSSDWSTVNGYQTSLSGAGDAFLLKLNSTGDGILYSTYFGGSEATFTDTAYDLAVDASGNVYIAGDARSADMPLKNAYDSTLDGTRDAFVAKFDTSQSGASSLLYSTFFGGSGVDYANTIDVDSTGAFVIAGYTDSTDLTTLNAYQTSSGGGVDAFVTRFDSSGSAITYSTYLGGTLTDWAEVVAIDNAGNIYVGGDTDGGIPTTAGAFDISHNGSDDGFVTKIDPTQSGAASFVYSTYLGGSAFDYVIGLDVDDSGVAYVTGFANASFPTTADGYDRVVTGANDGFFATLSPDGSSLTYSTFLGGDGQDRGMDVVWNAATGSAYVGGTSGGATGWSGSPTSLGTLGDRDAFVIKYTFNQPPAATNNSYTVVEGGTLIGNVITDNTGAGVDSDPDVDPLTASVVEGPLHGSLMLNPDGSFTYTPYDEPASNFADSDSFTYQLSDGKGGTDTATVTITVTPDATNDAPVNSVPGNQTTGEDTPLVFSASGGNRIIVHDDSGGNPIEVTLSTTNGTVTLATTAGLTITDGADGTALVTFEGTLNDINTALDGLTYTPDNGYNGTDTLTITTDDQGNTGTGGTLTDDDTIDITVGVATNTAPTFGTGVGDGIVTTAIGSSTDNARSTAVQPDGKILSAGYSWNGSNYDFALTRHNVDGTLDTGFSTDGKVTTSIGIGSAYGQSVAVQADGKILVGGYAAGLDGDEYALARYNSDGSLDTSFSGDGVVTTSFGVGDAYGRNLTLQADGKILVTGYFFNGAANVLSLARYNADGSLDTSFSGDGLLTTSFGGVDNYGSDVAVQSDGAIVVVGGSSAGGTLDFAVVRYDSSGNLDTTFSGDGLLTTPIGAGFDNSYSVSVQDDGKILVAGLGLIGGNYDFALVRCNSNGTLDTSFGGGDGIVTTAVGAGNDTGYSVTVQDDGKILVAGLSLIGGNDDFALVRYNSDGSLDTSFGGGDGIATTAVGAGNDRGYSVLVQTDGKILVAGTSNNGSNDDFALVRYNSDGSLDTSFDAIFINTLDGAPSFTEGGAAVVLDADVDVNDVELNALNGGLGNYAGASLTLVRNGGASADDAFSLNDGNGITLSGGNLIKNSQVIATFDTTTTPGELVVSFTNAGGEISTAVDVDNILRQITYANSNDTPPASVQIDWTFDDGNTGTQGSGGALTATGSTTVNITPTNDDPTNAGTLPSDLVFLQDTQGKLNLSLIDLTDVDAGSSDLTLTITSANGHLQTMGWPGLTLVASQDSLELTGNLTDLNDFLNDTNSIDYEHATPGMTGDNVDLITIEITDNGNTGSGGGGTITLGTVNIDIIDPSPQIDLDLDDSGGSGSDFATTWTQGGGQVAVADSDALISDPDSGTLESLTIVLTNHLDGADERLVANTTGTSIGVSYAQGAGKYYVYLTGADTVANYIQVLKTVTYDNTAASPTTADRVITFQASDGAQVGNTAMTTLTIDAAATWTIEGYVYEDVDGDGDVVDDGVGVGSVVVHLYRDGGDGNPDGVDDVYVTTEGTDAGGQYMFGDRADGTYWVVVDSTSIAPTAGYNGGSDIGDVWAEQTYGSAGSVTQSGAFYAYSLVDGSVYGGKRGEVSDDDSSLAGAEHVTTVVVSGANASGVDYGFSFNTITNTRDGGDDDLANDRTQQGTLRQFMQHSNAIAGTQSSQFAISTSDTNYDAGTNSYHIAVSGSALPFLNAGAILDATTQSGYDGTPSIDVDGSLLGGPSDHGFQSDGDNIIIRGFVIRNFSGAGIAFAGSGDHAIEANYIGTDVTGTLAQGNGVGIYLGGGADSVTIGGSGANEGNLISGNLDHGIHLDGAASAVIEGNLIGTDINGTADLGNAGNGIYVDASAGNTIGGSAAGAGNLISGNDTHGILVDKASSTGNVIQGNYIGTNAAGDAAIGNTYHGVYISNASSNTIGGVNPGEGNLISGNAGHGILIQEFGTHDNVVQGNKIGTNAAGDAGVANQGDGIRIFLGAYDNTIGGTADGAGNIIAYNDGIGVNLFNPTGTGNAILRNAIYGNAGLGINLDGGTEDGFGVTGNDTGPPHDTDTGANDLQNYPVLTSAATNGVDSITIDGGLTSTASTTFRIEFFASTTFDPSGYGEAERYLGYADVTTDITGGLVFSVPLSVSVNAGEFITATATDAAGNTSEFGQVIVATLANAAPTIAIPGGAVNYAENDPPTVIDSTATTTDPDSADFDGGTLTVDFIANGTTNDRLAIRDQGAGAGNIQLSGNNVVYDSGGPLIPIGTFSGGTDGSTPLVITFNTAADAARVQAVMRNITFENVSEDPSTAPRTVQFVLTDGDGGTSNSVTELITVMAVNDDPYNAGSLPTDVVVAEDVMDFVDLSSVNLIDLDAGNNLIQVTLTTSTGGNLWASSDFDVTVLGSGTSTLQLTGGVSDLNNFFSSAFRFQYRHATAHINGSNADTIQITVNDLGNTGSGGSGNIILGTVNVDIDAVNDAPINSVAGPKTVVEETPTAISGLSISDVDAATADLTTRLVVSNGVLNVTLAGGASISAGSNGSSDLTIQGSVSDINSTLSSLTYTGNTDVTGTGADTLSVITNDLGNTGSGGPNTTVNFVQIDVTGVNDAPVRTAGSVNNLTVAEDSGLTSLGLSGVTYGPGGGADESPQTLTYEVTVIPDSNFFGKIYLADGTTEVTTGFYSLAQIQGMQFSTLTNENGGPSFFSYRVQDSGGTGNGGSDLLTESIQITVTPQNDAPTVIGESFVAVEGIPFTSELGLNDLLLNDSDVEGDTLSVNTTPVSGPANGTLVLNADGTFTYTPNNNFNGTDSFVYEVLDGNGGTAQATATFTVQPREIRILFTTQSDVNNSKVPGISSWDAGDVLAIGDPNLSFEPVGSDGSVLPYMDLEAFAASNNMTINGLHFVSNDITVGRREQCRPATGRSTVRV